MPEIIHCPDCQSQLQVPEGLFGEAVKCPKCGVQFTAGGARQSSAPPASPPSYDPPQPLPFSIPSELPRRDSPPSNWDHLSTQAPEPPPQSPPSRDRFDSEYDQYPSQVPYTRDYRPRETHYRRRDFSPHRAGLVLTLGIISLVAGAIGLITCPFVINVAAGICGVCAWVMGGNDLKAIRNGTMDPDGESSTNSGWMCGIIGTVGNGLIFLACGALFLFWLLLAAAAGP